MHDLIHTLNLSLLHAGHIALDNQWQYDNVISPFSRIYLITKGEGWVFHNNQKIILKPGYLYLIPSFTYSRYHCDTYLEQYYLSVLDEIEGGGSMYDIQKFDYEKPVFDRDQALFERLLQLNPNREIAKPDPKTYDNQADLLSFNQTHNRLSVAEDMETRGILLQIVSRFAGETSLQTTSKKKALYRFGGLLRTIHTHLDQKYTVEQLANEVHLNPDYFSRLFLELMGLRPLDYINNKRLERAQLLLTTSTLSIKEITEQLGFSDVFYFSKLFKKRFNISPAKYRDNSWGV